ncbi:extensin [Asbolus verrucosus]|uniref:Extensin n=1 Tax=Asbolus verrucosus TaxID=1661398 RepID=A0A482VSN8_ASBVE|nr:extensin [Asbolus verrucosus]
MSYLIDERINFNNPTVGKPANLQNSAVLRMLEEEEQRQRSGQSPSKYFRIGYTRPLRDQIKWPPPELEQRNHQRSSFKDVVTPGTESTACINSRLNGNFSTGLKRVAWPPPNEGENYSEQSPVQAQGGPQYSSQSPTLQNHSPAQQQVSHDPSHRYPLKPLDISNGTSNYQQPAVSPVANQRPLGYQQTAANKQWAPVLSPVATPGQPQFKPPYQQTQQYQQNYQYQQYQTSAQGYQQQPAPQPISPQPYQSSQFNQPQQQYQPQQYQPSQTKTFSRQPPQSSVQSVAATNQGIPPQPQAAIRPVEPPPSTITLRQQAPVSQAPPPVVTSQPATATLKGGKHLRGDLKWPPENVKRQTEEENRLRLELAKGPAFRPRLVRKDYGPFFAQHALNASYPGYKAPPGTQFYEQHGAY